MNKEFSEILLGFKRALQLMGKPEKASLIAASFLMLIAGVLTNLPALILGRLVDKVVSTTTFRFNLAAPFL